MLKFKTIKNATQEIGVSYLGGVGISTKIIKSQKVNGTLIYCIYLAPATTSGYNTCQSSTPECSLGCLNTSGRAKMEYVTGVTMIQDARVKKTKLFFEDTAYFMQWLIAELKMHQNRANNKNMGFAVRLNGTSDIDWQHVYVDGKNIFQLFPEISFYDYTKIATKFYNIPQNYDLTYSYTGKNGAIAKRLLKQGFNVAVIFDVKKGHALPKTFGGFEVIDGDLTDLRISDKKGIIVGLRFKEIANKDASNEIKNSIFVVSPNDVRCNSNVHELEYVLDMV
jgi:hypothetical protein